MRGQLKRPRPQGGDLRAAGATGEGAGAASEGDGSTDPAALQPHPRRLPYRFVTQSKGVLSHHDGKPLVFTQREAARQWAKVNYSPGLFSVRNVYTDELAGGYVVQRGRRRVWLEERNG